MNLLLIIFFIVILCLSSNLLKKHNNCIDLIPFFLIILFYFFLSYSFFHSESFYPTEQLKHYQICGNYYNLLLNSMKKGTLYIQDLKSVVLLDTSIYNNNIYIYFGITPLLLFYLPFNLVTHLYLTDKMIVFILSSIIFFLYLFLLKIVAKDFNLKIKHSIEILSIFLVGICGYIPFLVIRSSIYEVAILTANICLLFSLLILFYLSKSNRHTKTFISILGVLLALSIGARPHYILHIPIFFLVLLYFEYTKNKHLNNFIEITFLFFTPCIVYGIVLACYNFFRFDSFFEFGWKYQYTEIKHKILIKDFINNFFISLKYNLFQTPTFNSQTFFGLAEAKQHSFGNELVTGIIYTFPLIANFIFGINFIKDTYITNKKTFLFILVIIWIIIINFLITSSIGGIITRYVFEYIPLIIIISLLISYSIFNKTENKYLNLSYNIIFIISSIFSIYINISLLFCDKNSLYFNINSMLDYSQLINFLF